MHVLRAEKGYPIIGQDTDGTVTPQDLGMAWVVSKKKPDFIGKRSFARADEPAPGPQAPGRPAAGRPGRAAARGRPARRARRSCPRRRCRCSGHVTSSYRSAALGRTFALALVQGRPRADRRDAVRRRSDGRLVPVTVAEPVLYDPEGARRDG